MNFFFSFPQFESIGLLPFQKTTYHSEGIGHDGGELLVGHYRPDYNLLCVAYIRIRIPPVEAQVFALISSGPPRRSLLFFNYEF